MRTNPKTIKLAKIRRLIREAIRWHKVDNGMPHFWTSDNYKRSGKVNNPSIGNFPYYVKSDRAIRDIAEKIYGVVEKQEDEGYVIICTDQLSNEHSFLFWKPEGKGYTSDIDKAGIWKEKPTHPMRDVVIEKKKLLQMFKPKKIVGDSMLQIMDLKGEFDE